MKGAAMYNSVQAAGSDVEVLQHVALVKRIAYHLMNKLPETVLVDDLIQAGMLGLLEASKNFDPAQGASFDTYAGIRIRGAMLDEVRRLDWTPRSVHKKARMVTEAIRAIENVTGRDAKGPEIAEHLGISIEDYHQILRDTMSSRTFSVEELAQTGDHFLDEWANTDADPADRLSQDSFQKALANAILMLPERERLIVSLYYDDELNLREIGEVLGISESRVSQISSQAMLRLRSRLVEWIDSKS
jgi:RNA polymerase sigma factor FliA